MTNNSVNFTQAAAIGGMAIVAQAFIQPTTFLGWTGAAAITAIGTKIITKAAGKIKVWYAYKTRYMQLGYIQYNEPFLTINKVEGGTSKKEEEVLKKYTQKYLEGKIAHLLPSNEQEKKEMLDTLSHNFVNSVKFDAQFLGVCMGGSMAAAALLAQSTLDEHPGKLLNRFIREKRGSVLFHGLHRLTSEEKKGWSANSSLKDIAFYNRPKGFEIIEALGKHGTDLLNREETFSAGFSDFFGKEMLVTIETLGHLALDPIYPWVSKTLKEFMEKHDGKAAVCIMTGKGDVKILHITFKDSFFGHAVVWYADAKTCSYFYLDLNGRFRAVFNADELAHNVLDCINEKYRGASPSIKEVCLISQAY